MPERTAICVRFILSPGELHITHEPAIIRTALGVCIGITFLHREAASGRACSPVVA